MKLQLSRNTENLSVEAVQDVDVTPVMNMFVILIPFLVSMAVFTHLSILSFSLPPNAGAGLDQSGGKPKLKLTVVVTPGYFAVTYGEKMVDSIPNTTSPDSYDLLLGKVKSLREKIEVQDEAVVAVRDAVVFQQMVRVMDICRTAGFEKIGVSSATADAGKGV